MGDLFNLTHDVGGDNHRFAKSGLFGDKPEYVATTSDVQSVGGLVEQKNRRIVNQRPGQDHPSFHAGRETSARRIGVRRRPQLFQHFVGALFWSWYSLYRREEENRLPWRKAFRQARFCWNPAESFAHANRVPASVDPCDENLAFVGFHERGQDSKRRRLARAIRPQQAVYFSRFNPKRKLIDGEQRRPTRSVKPFHEPRHGDQMEGRPVSRRPESIPRPLVWRCLKDYLERALEAA